MDPLIPALLIVIAVLALAAVVLGVVAVVRNRTPDASRLTNAVREELERGSVAIQQGLSTQRTELADRLDRESQNARRSEEDLKRTILEHMTSIRRETEEKLEKVRDAVERELKANAERIDRLTSSNVEKQSELQRLLTTELDKLRQENEAKLEQMRQTVDEKLQGTLEKRLGESFKLVTEHLMKVSEGLGDMQKLAADVGGLQRVLTNVKSRGTWGEVQLERQLEDVMTTDQYEKNVAIKPGTGERVEFAVRLPGRDADGEPVYLPIDSKLPREDFDRLQEARDAGDKVAADAAAAALERAIVTQAKKISSLYIEPPRSTDFAIMYLPYESLFAEVVSRPGLMERLQRDHRVQIAGPSTLMAYLNSLQMGFRTLAIEKRSSEVWQVLAAAKSEFQKYGEVWAKLEKQLQTAQNTVSEAGRRTRAVERKLRGVELSETVSTAQLMIDDVFEDLEPELPSLERGASDE